MQTLSIHTGVPLVKVRGVSLGHVTKDRCPYVLRTETGQAFVVPPADVKRILPDLRNRTNNSFVRVGAGPALRELKWGSTSDVG